MTENRNQYGICLSYHLTLQKIFYNHWHANSIEEEKKANGKLKDVSDFGMSLVIYHRIQIAQLSIEQQCKIQLSFFD